MTWNTVVIWVKFSNVFLFLMMLFFTVRYGIWLVYFKLLEVLMQLNILRFILFPGILTNLLIIKEHFLHIIMQLICW